jgi:uncharacterized membrane protein (DUF485 family)
MKQSFIVAAVMLALWIVLAFVAAIPSGLVHIPLGAGVVFITRGIVLSGSTAPS